MSGTDVLPVDLVEAARAGERAAVEAVVTAYLPVVYTAVARAAGAGVDVDDVVQETMIRLVTGLPGLPAGTEVRSWLLATALQRLADAERQAHAGTARSVPHPPHQLDQVDPAAEFAELSLLQDALSNERREVAAAAAWLDPGHREVLSLWWLEQAGRLRRAEIAEALGEQPAHVAVRVQRMRAQLDTGRQVLRALATTPGCAGLRQVRSGWDGQPGPLWRKRFARHVRHCRSCSGRSRRLVPAERLLTGLALLPVPAGLRARSTSWVSSGPGTSTGVQVTPGASTGVQVTPGAGTGVQVSGAGAAHAGGLLSTGAAKAVAVLAGVAVAAGAVLGAAGYFRAEPAAPQAAPQARHPAPVASPSALTATAAPTATTAALAPTRTTPRAAAGSTFSTRLPALPAVRSLTQLGPITQNSRIGGRDGGQSAAYGDRSVWIFADTTMRDPWGFLSNSGAVTGDLDASDGITLTSSGPARIDQGRNPFPIVPLTAAEKAFQKAHSKDEGCSTAIDRYCGAVFGFWPGPVIADPARGRVLFTYGKLCRGGASGTPCTGVKGLGVGIAVVDMRSGTVSRLTATGGAPVRSIEGRDDTLFFPDGTGFTAAGLAVEGNLYLYGQCRYDCMVARVPLSRVRDRSAWRVRTAAGGWSTDLGGGSRLTAPGGAGQTVLYSPALKAYVNIFMPYGTTEVRYQVGGSPFGPWSKGRLAGETQPGRTGTGIDYSLYAHPEYAQKNGLVQYLSYFRPGDGSQRLLRLEFARP